MLINVICLFLIILWVCELNSIWGAVDKKVGICDVGIN